MFLRGSSLKNIKVSLTNMLESLKSLMSLPTDGRLPLRYSKYGNF